MAAALALLAAACGGGGEEITTSQTSKPSPAALPVVVSSDLAVGANRFALGLIDQAQQTEILGAQLHFSFFKVDSSGGATRKSEADPTPIRVTKSYTHTHTDGTVETHEAGDTGVYVASVAFDAAGDWGVEITGTANGQPLKLTSAFSVGQKSLSPALGDPAPRSVQPILKDVASITDLDTSDPPNPAMHDMTIADAVTSGKPTVIVFATPAFCVSRICGPAKQVVDQLYDKYKGQANFIHVEPYDLAKARGGQGLQVLPFITDDWGLQTEPWVFLVDKKGDIAAKFESVVGYDELEQALLPLLGGG